MERENEKEQQILRAYRHIGDTIYYAIFDIPGEEPRLQGDKIHYIEASPSRINFMGKGGTLICSADAVGKWHEDFFISFSSSEVEKEIEKWRKKKLGIS